MIHLRRRRGARWGARLARLAAALGCALASAGPWWISGAAAADESAPRAVYLEDVQIGSAAELEAVAFMLSGDAQGYVRRGPDPLRLVVDFPGVQPRAAPPALPAGLRLLAGVEIGSGETQGAARALIHLRRSAEVDVARSPGVISIILRPSPAPASPEPPSAPPGDPATAAATSGAGASAPAPAAPPRDDGEQAADGASGEIVPLYLVRPALAPPAPQPADAPATPLADAPLGALDLVHVEVFGVPELERRVRVAVDGTITLPLVGSLAVAGLTPDALERDISRRLADGFVKDPQVSVFVEEHRSRRVSVSGAVKNPGSFEILRPATLLEALALAGGALPEEAAASVQIVRPGVERPIQVDRLALGSGELAQNVALLPGDLVHVPFEEMLEIEVQGRVERPARYKVPRSRGLTLLRAVTLAGGTVGKTAGRRVEVLRRSGDPRSRTLVVNLNRIRAGKEPDLPLQPDDIVLVR